MADHSHYKQYYSAPRDWQRYIVADWGSDISEPRMKTLTTMFKKLVDGDTQALAKAGFINGDLELTQLGKDELLAIIFDANKPALVAAAKAKVEEDQSKK